MECYSTACYPAINILWFCATVDQTTYVPLVLKFADFKHGLHSALFSAGVLHKHSFLPFSVSTIDPACVLVQCQLSNYFHRWKKLKHLQSQPDKKIINNYNKKTCQSLIIKKLVQNFMQVS